MANKVNCPQCGNEIGEDVEVIGLDIHLLHVGGLLVKREAAFCDKCFFEIYWDVTDKKVKTELSKRGVK